MYRHGVRVVLSSPQQLAMFIETLCQKEDTGQFVKQVTLFDSNSILPTVENNPILNVQSLPLTYFDIKKQAAYLFSLCPNLEKIALRLNPQEVLQWPSMWADSELQIPFGPLMVKDGTPLDSVSPMTRLRSLTLSYVRIGDSFVQNLHLMPQLELLSSMNISCATSQDVTIHFILAGLHKLRSLRLIDVNDHIVFEDDCRHDTCTCSMSLLERLVFSNRQPYTCAAFSPRKCIQKLQPGAPVIPLIRSIPLALTSFTVYFTDLWQNISLEVLCQVIVLMQGMRPSLSKSASSVSLVIVMNDELDRATAIWTTEI